MKPGRIAMATLGVGAALTAGAWTLSAAAVPLPADPSTIPVVGTSQPFLAHPGTTDPAADSARTVADAEARLLAINSHLQALVEQQAATGSVAAAPNAAAAPAAAPAAAAPPIAAAPQAAAPTTAAPPAHTVTGASGSTSAYGEDTDDGGADTEDHQSEEQDD